MHPDCVCFLPPQRCVCGLQVPSGGDEGSAYLSAARAARFAAMHMPPAAAACAPAGESSAAADAAQERAHLGPIGIRGRR